MKKKPYVTFRQGGKVSIWVGNFSSVLQLDDYLNLSRAFEDDFGFRLNPRDMPEISVMESPISIEDLVSSFSWSELFAVHVAEIAKQRNLPKATTMVVFYNFEFDPKMADCNPRSPLFFLGAFPFQQD